MLASLNMLSWTISLLTVCLTLMKLQNASNTLTNATEQACTDEFWSQHLSRAAEQVWSFFVYDVVLIILLTTAPVALLIWRVASKCLNNRAQKQKVMPIECESPPALPFCQKPAISPGNSPISRRHPTAPDQFATPNVSPAKTHDLPSPKSDLSSKPSSPPLYIETL